MHVLTVSDRPVTSYCYFGGLGGGGEQSYNKRRYRKWQQRIVKIKNVLGKICAVRPVRGRITYHNTDRLRSALRADEVDFSPPLRFWFRSVAVESTTVNGGTVRVGTHL
jgi:hypothetical protein